MTTHVGVIGIGKMGILHSAIMNSLPNTEVKAISEKDALIARGARNFLPKTITVYKECGKMLEEEALDAVLVTTPIGTHAQLIDEIVKTNDGLSIFVEKPLASSYEQAKLACDAARKSRGVHMVGFHKRFSPIFQKAKQLILDEAVGELILLRAYSFSSDALAEGRSWRFRSGEGGVLLDLGPHVLDILMWLFGEVTSVAAVKRSIFSREVVDQVSSVLSFASGFFGSMDICWSIRDFRLPEISIEVFGKKGTIKVTDDSVALGTYEPKRTVTWHRQSFDTSVPFLMAEPEYTKQAEAFLRSMQERQLAETNFFEAAKVNELIGRIDESSS